MQPLFWKCTTFSPSDVSDSFLTIVLNSLWRCRFSIVSDGRLRRLAPGCAGTSFAFSTNRVSLLHFWLLTSLCHVICRQPGKLAEAFKYFVQGMGYSKYAPLPCSANTLSNQQKSKSTASGVCAAGVYLGALAVVFRNLLSLSPPRRLVEFRSPAPMTPFPLQAPFFY